MTSPRTTAQAPSRDDPGTIAPAAPGCPVCARPFTPTGRQRYCSTRCRKAAFRRRHSTALPPVVVPLQTPRRDRTVYECGSCGSRQLGQQRCSDCGTFSTSLGLGGACPCCQELVTLTDLDLTT